MPIPVTCEYCGVSYRITDRAAGKKVHCKDCDERVDVPGRAPSAANRGRRPAASAPTRASSQSVGRRTAASGGNRPGPRNDDTNTKNIIIGVGIGAVAVLGGITFLIYGRGEDNPSPADNAVAAFAGADRPDFEAMQAEQNQFVQSQRQRIEADAQRMTDELRATSENMGAPNLSPSGRRPLSGPGREPTNPFRKKRPPAQSNFRGTQESQSGETDDELQKLAAAMKTPNRPQAVMALSRSSRQTEAAKILADNIGQDDDMHIIMSLSGLEAAGEAELLRLISSTNDTTKLRFMVSGLMRCGTSASETTLNQLTQHQNPGIRSIAQAAMQRIRMRTNR